MNEQLKVSIQFKNSFKNVQRNLDLIPFRTEKADIFLIVLFIAYDLHKAARNQFRRFPVKVINVSDFFVWTYRQDMDTIHIISS